MMPFNFGSYNMYLKKKMNNKSSSPPPATYIVPNIVGMTSTNATLALMGVNLTVGRITGSSGNVTFQCPPAGTTLSLGQKVDYNLTVGAPVVTYYVAKTGLDTNDALTEATPLLTIQRSIVKIENNYPNQLVNVYVKNGTYIEMVVCSTDFIKLLSYPNHTPAISGDATLPGDYGTLFRTYSIARDCTLDGFDIINANMTGTHVSGYAAILGGSRSIMRHCRVHEIWDSGVTALGDDCLLEYNTVYNCCMNNSAGLSPPGWGAGLTLNSGTAANEIPDQVSRGIIRYNIVYDNFGEGISTFISNNVQIYGNTTYDNWSANLYFMNCVNCSGYNNLVYASTNPTAPARYTPSQGITLADERPISVAPLSSGIKLHNNFVRNTAVQLFAFTQIPGTGLVNAEIFNNTFDTFVATGQGGPNNITNSNSQIRNNIITDSANSVIPGNTGLTFSNNNWNITAPANASGTGNVIGNPLLAHTGATTRGALSPNWFKITAGSPCINAGVSVGLTTDYFGNAITGLPDIGGHEL
jgi:hypothetical protein